MGSRGWAPCQSGTAAWIKLRLGTLGVRCSCLNRGGWIEFCKCGRDNMRPFLLLWMLAGLSFQKTCEWKGQEVCEGAVTKETKTLVQICENGILKFRPRSKVAPGYPRAGRECVWYGEVLCDGVVIIDLHRWWFESRCSNKRMTVTPRSWEEVVNDPRFKP